MGKPHPIHFYKHFFNSLIFKTLNYRNFVCSFPGLTGFDSIVLYKYKHVARCVISALI